MSTSEKQKENESMAQSQNQSTANQNSSTSSLEHKLEYLLQNRLIVNSPEVSPMMNCSCGQSMRQQMVSQFKESLLKAHDDYIENIADNRQQQDRSEHSLQLEVNRIEDAYSAIQEMLIQHKTSLLSCLYEQEQNNNQRLYDEQVCIEKALEEVQQIGEDIDINLNDIVNCIDQHDLEQILSQYSLQIEQTGSSMDSHPQPQHLDSLHTLYQQLDRMICQLEVILNPC